MLGTDCHAGSVTMRYQPDPEDPLSFFDVRGAARVSVHSPAPAFVETLSHRTCRNSQTLHCTTTATGRYSLT